MVKTYIPKYIRQEVGILVVWILYCEQVKANIDEFNRLTESLLNNNVGRGNPCAKNLVVT